MRFLQGLLGRYVLPQLRECARFDVLLQCEEPQACHWQCGVWKSYYENGKIKSEGNRLNFELDSVWKFYNEDGKLLVEINYKNGKKNGIKTTWLD